MAQKKKLSKLLKTVSTASMLLVLAGCSCFPKLPDIRPKQILQRFNKCKQYTVEFGDQVKFKFEKDIPLNECLVDGYFVLTDSELVELRRKYQEAKKCFDQTCKKGNEWQ